MTEFLMANHKNVHCGEIFFTFQQKFLIHCLLCDSTFHDYSQYLIHISEAHNLYETVGSNNDAGNPSQTGTEMLVISSENMPESIIKLERVLEQQEGGISSIAPDNLRIQTTNITDVKNVHGDTLQKSNNKKFGKSSASKTVKRRKYCLKSTEETKVQLYGCATCPETFSGTRELAKHVKKCPVQEKPKENIFKYECLICKSSFKEYIHLKAHRRLHVDKKVNRIACPSCPKTFFTLAQLSYHQRCHDEVQHLLCGVCGLTFTSIAPFLDHLHQHESHQSNEKPFKEPSFKCPICPSSFYERSHLIGHMPSHHERKEHQCNYCNAEFDRKNSLRIHLKTHNDKFKYVCETCDVPFNSSGRLNAHYKKKHASFPFTAHQNNLSENLVAINTPN